MSFLFKPNASVFFRSCFFIIAIALTFSAQAAPKKVLYEKWLAHDASSTRSIKHQQWQVLLSRYIRADNGINKFDYAAVKNSDKQRLKNYLLTLQTIDPRQLNRAEQFAYWVNLYNAATINLVLDHYPVSSIKKIGGILSGPWDKKILNVSGSKLSLNNVEHNILRPIFKDQRIHYVVNCASVGCPNLPKKALTSKNYKQLLERAAYEFVRHPRAVHFEGDVLVLSSIYKWYAEDFGSTRTQRLQSIARYASPSLKQKILKFKGDIEYQYNWALNKG